jgi:hypothetical protein
MDERWSFRLLMVCADELDQEMTYDEVVRWQFLAAVAREVPEVLQTLRAVPVQNETALQQWANRWGLADYWCLEFARATCRAWLTSRRRDAWYDGGIGAWVSEPDDRVCGGFPLKNLDGFVWLARFQCRPGGGTFQEVAGEFDVDAGKFRRSCVEAAKRLRLSLRPVKRGRPLR